MDDALVLHHAQQIRVFIHPVLILVLMDDALVHSLTNLERDELARLNPCFNG